jgi:hypothetical protein
MNEHEYMTHFAIQKLRDAMQDLLVSPNGFVPMSAAPFYDARTGRISTTKIRIFLEGGSQ